MRFFKRKKEIVDLGEIYKKRQDKLNQLKENLNENSNTEDSQTNSTGSGILGFFGNMNSVASNTQETASAINTESAYEKKRRLAKKLRDMTEKIEDLSNQIYHLQQRVEVLERKNSIESY